MNRVPKDEKAGFSCFLCCHLCPFLLTVFIYKTCESYLVCFLFVLALEYPNLDISETTRDYWVITGNSLILFPLSPYQIGFLKKTKKLHVGKKNVKKIKTACYSVVGLTSFFGSVSQRVAFIGSGVGGVN